MAERAPGRASRRGLAGRGGAAAGARLAPRLRGSGFALGPRVLGDRRRGHCPRRDRSMVIYVFVLVVVSLLTIAAMATEAWKI